MVRHQTGAVMATVLDFLMMIVWVEPAPGSPVSGAAVGAASGAMATSCWGGSGSSTPAAVRRRGRSCVTPWWLPGSLGWNSLGQYLLLRWTPLPYVMSRVVVAALVGMGWNFPMHRRFVFRVGPRQDHGGA